ncbi:MAG TPA: DUF2796 domain-containing protein, partial [Steroidobacteraceae bacterium]
MTPRTVSLAGAVCCSLLLSILATSPSHADEFEQHPPHEHGKVTINAALDGNELVIEIDSPAINVIGFEHEPRTESERAAVNVAASLLQNGRG